MEYSAGPSCDLKYLDEVYLYYRALEEQNYAVDIIGVDDDYEKYDVVIAPLLYMIKTGTDEKLRAFVKKGGTFVTSYFSGIVDEHDLVITGGYPGKLRDILGIWVEESDALPSDHANHFIYEGKEYPAKLLCDLMHLEGAQEMAKYQEDFYAGTPVLTENSFGAGRAYYVGTRSSEAFYRKFIRNCMEEKGIRPVLETPEGVEVTERFKEDRSILFVLNHNNHSESVQLRDRRKELLTGNVYDAFVSIEVAAKEVMILEK